MKIKLIILSLFILIIEFSVNGQTPTPNATPDSEGTPQVSPTPPPITDPQAKSFEDQFNYLRKLDEEIPKLLESANVNDLEIAKSKAEERMETSRKLFIELDNSQDLAERVAPTVENAKIQLQFILRQGELLGYDRVSKYYRLIRNWNKVIEVRKIQIDLIRKTLLDANLKTSKFYKNTSNSIKLSELTGWSDISSICLYNIEKPSETLIYADEAIKVAQFLATENKENIKIFNFFKYKEAELLDTKASAYKKLNQPNKSIDFYQQALSIYQSLPNQQGEIIRVLQSIGSIYSNILDYENALNYYNRGLKLSEQINSKENQIEFSTLIGVVYFNLGNEEKTKEYFNRNLAIVTSQEYADLLRNRKATIPFPEEWLKGENTNPNTFTERQSNFFILSTIAETYFGLKEYDKAIEFSKKSLQFADSFDMPYLKYVNLSLLAGEYKLKEDWQNALDYYQQSVEISKNLADKRDYGFDLANLAQSLLKTKKTKEALSIAEQSLLIFQTLQLSKEDVNSGYSSALNVLSQIHHELGNRKLAVFYGKQAVNAIQRERQQLKNLDQTSQRGYLQENIKPYRRLISWMIAENRVAEAEQVLQMLKEEELSDYLRRDDKVARELLAKIPLDSTEKEALQRFEAIADDISKIGSQVADLEKESKSYPKGQFPKQPELEQKINALEDSRVVFDKFLKELSGKLFNQQTKQKDPRVSEVSGTQSLLASLQQPNTVIISTIVEDNQLNLIVTTLKTRRAHTVNISAEKLNELAIEFREALKDPKIDPRPVGKQLYDLLFPNSVQKDLAGVKADTIIWSLDGILRYLPMSALWDGNQYLVEKYSLGIITLASQNNLKLKPLERNNLTALGLGVSKEAKVSDLDGTQKTFPALSAIPQELCSSIIKDPNKAENCVKLNSGKNGVINGISLTDEEFTLRNFIDEVGDFPIVHIASHFSLNPGNEGTSYLLLGGDTERKLTLVEMKVKVADKLANTELLTLSACNTGMSAGVKASGEEIESFAAIAQELGAKSVVSSLWAVADPSTRDLMTEFYRQLQSNPQIGKAEALRNAQLTLLQGKYKTGETPTWRGTQIIGTPTIKLPAFKTDANAPFAHPYYWSPFILIGNWK